MTPSRQRLRASFEPDLIDAIGPLLVPKLTRWIPGDPTAPQAAFLLLTCLEALFGGSAGPGKSWALLAGALQYVDVPGYAALLLRRTYPQLTQSEGLIPRSHEWLRGTDAVWSEKHTTWTFPSGATVKFGSMQYDNDRFQYQGGAYQYVGFDELTHFTETQFRYMFSRLRRPQNGPLSHVPLRVRAASNPGGAGHDWVKRRFLTEGRQAGRIFIPARLEDNPHLDREEYIRSLAELDPVTRKQLLDGDWSARNVGAMFRREWFEVIEPGEVPRTLRKVRFWDLAATEPSNANPDPDWTRGALVGEHDGVWYVLDIAGARTRPHGVEQLVAQRAREDGRGVPIVFEQEPGSSGKTVVDSYRRRVLVGYDVRAERATGDKQVRARPFASAAGAGNVKLIRGPWVGEFLDEVEAFPFGGHDDQVDAVGGAIASMRGGGAQAWVPTESQRRASVWR